MRAADADEHAAVRRTGGDPREVEAREVIAPLQARDSLMVLDCREPEAWLETRIPASRHLSMQWVPQRLSDLDPNAAIIVVDAHGERAHRECSLIVADYLQQQGFDARGLRGVLAIWINTGGAVDATPLRDRR